MILVGDIGGTKTNLAYFTAHGGSLTLSLVESYPSQLHRSLTDIITEFLRKHPAQISTAAFGIAGPVVDGRCEATNLPWVVDSRDVAGLLKREIVGLINDLEGTAYGTLHLRANDRLQVVSGKPRPHGTVAIIAAGTGLGEAGLVWDGDRYKTLPSEGGHADFAPRNELEIDLLRFLLKKYDRVSYERLLSGPGLYNLYEYFKSVAAYPEPGWLQDQIAAGDPSAVISKTGLEEKDEACVKALDTFVSLYGAEAGNLALKLLSTGGVFVGGGIAPKIASKMQKGTFRDSFTRKGRFGELLNNCMVRPTSR
jgi:glucokinase